MPQTVFDVGDLLTSRLNLGVTPDGTTTATFAVYRPDGTALTGLNASAWVGMEKTVQWWATDTGASGGPTTLAVGDWLVVWTVTGTGASTTAKVYPVRSLRAASATRPSWSPLLSDVADYVPWLTVDTTTPGSQVFLGTFTGATTPTDEQAQRVVDKAATLTAAGLGAFTTELYAAAGAATAVRAAATLARIYARNPDDLARADTLDRAADSARTLLVDAAEQLGTATTVPTPVWFFPTPVAHGDMDL